MSIKKQLELIRELDDCYSTQTKALLCRDLTLTIDVEAGINGKNAVKYKPKLPVNLIENSKITLQLQIFGKIQPIGRIYVTKKDN